MHYPSDFYGVIVSKPINDQIIALDDTPNSRL